MSLRLLPLIIGPAILLPLAVYAFRHRRVRGAAWYGTLLLAIALWSGMYAVELVVGDPAHKLLALKIKYLGVVALPVAWLGFILDFVARDPAVVRRVGRRMTVIAVIALMTAWTNDWHGLFWGQMTVDPVGTLYTLAGRGPGFWLNVVYTYSALALGLAILVGQAIQSPYLYRKRAVILVLATILPWLGNLIFVALLFCLLFSSDESCLSADSNRLARSRGCKRTGHFAGGNCGLPACRRAKEKACSLPAKRQNPPPLTARSGEDVRQTRTQPPAGCCWRSCLLLADETRVVAPQ